MALPHSQAVRLCLVGIVLLRSPRLCTALDNGQAAESGPGPRACLSDAGVDCNLYPGPDPSRPTLAARVTGPAVGGGPSG